MTLKIDTEIEYDLDDLQYDIEDSRETDRWSDAPPEVKELFHILGGIQLFVVVVDGIQLVFRSVRCHGYTGFPKKIGGMSSL